MRECPRSLRATPQIEPMSRLSVESPFWRNDQSTSGGGIAIDSSGPTSSSSGEKVKRTVESRQRALGWVAAVRTVLALLALPVAPFLFRHHFLVLVLLRPSQGVFLAGGFLARHDDVSLPLVLVSAIPLQLLIVWVFFLLGRVWDSSVDSDRQLPFVNARLLRPHNVE